VRAKSDGEEPGLGMGVLFGGGHVNVVCENYRMRGHYAASKDTKDDAVSSTCVVL
jgi:hypothetical protein